MELKKCSPFPITDPAIYGILNDIIQKIFPVGGLSLGIFFPYAYASASATGGFPILDVKDITVYS